MLRTGTHLGLAIAWLSVVVLGFALAQPPVAKPAAPPDLETIRKTQEANARLFKDVTNKLLLIAVELDKSDRPQDKDRAKTIRAALDVAQKNAAVTKFNELIKEMAASGTAPQPQDLEKLIALDANLAATVEEMLKILMTEDESTRLKAEIKRLEKFLKEAEEIKRREELLRTKVDAKKGDPAEIAKNQNDLAKETKDLAERMGGGKSEAKKPEEAKAQPKASDAKDGEKASEAKSDSKGEKAESKEGDPKAGSEDKPAKPAPKHGEAKPGEAKPGEAKPGEAKPGEAKPGEVKPGEAKPGEAKPGEAKPGEAKNAEAKPGEPKAGEAKPGDPNANKPEGPSKAQGDSKGDSKPSDAKAGQAKGMGGSSAPKDSAASKSGGGSGGSGGDAPPPPPPNPNQLPGRKAVEEAYPHQKGAEDELKKNNRDAASPKMDKAIDALARAIEEMKKRLKQLREEEMLKLLANLEARCNRMLAMQIEVYEETKAINNGIVANENRKTEADRQRSQQQGDKEKNIIAEAEKMMKLLETEGSAVAFAKVLEEVKGDMLAVQIRLEDTRVDGDTQAIQENIIAMLKEMAAALKKQQQDIKDQKPPSGPTPNSKPNAALIDQLAELKLIRALQNQVNLRTIMYGKKSDSEQASDPIVQGELRQLAARQVKLQDMIQKIATGANK